MKDYKKLYQQYLQDKKEIEELLTFIQHDYLKPKETKKNIIVKIDKKEILLSIRKEKIIEYITLFDKSKKDLEELKDYQLILMISLIDANLKKKYLKAEKLKREIDKIEEELEVLEEDDR